MQRKENKPLMEVHTEGGEKFKFTQEKAALLSEAASAAVAVAATGRG